MTRRGKYLPVQIDVEHEVPLFVGMLMKFFTNAGAGIVDEEVDVAERL